MHLLNVITVFALLLLVGAELSVSVFVNPSAWRLEPGPQSIIIGHLAAALGKVMPVWYAVSFVLLGAETWAFRHTSGLPVLIVAAVLWFLTSLASVLFLVPLNNLVIAGAPGWQEAHRRWDRRHRARVLVLAVVAALLTSVLVR